MSKVNIAEEILGKSLEYWKPYIGAEPERTACESSTSLRANSSFHHHENARRKCFLV